jgi:hypothetical protein
MGVYHLMGLGRSVGAITGPLSYLAQRYQHWNAEDRQFFARSGEVKQRQQGQKVGDVQALVLFTTPEVLSGDLSCFDYVDNPPGRIAEGHVQKGGATKETLRRLLRREWPTIAGGRKIGTIFWCEVDRRDIRSTYEHIIQVVAALSDVGGQGKEMWVNLTGGNNVLNFALELAATLSGDVARLYYVQAENPAAEKCVRFTAQNGYWVELPVMLLALGRLTLAILEMLEQGTISAADLYSRACTKYWDLMHGLDSLEAFVEGYLKPMWKQGLIAEADNDYIIGLQWKLIKPYQERLQEARQLNLTLEQLAQREPWIEREEITF